MPNINGQPFYNYLMSEYNHPFNGWDFSHLEGRRVDIHTDKAWDYTATVLAAMQHAASLLDMRTGGGERLAQFLALQPVSHVYATEGYAPNISTVRQHLEPLGVTVYEVHDERLPFPDASLDLIINRHGSYDPREIHRILKPGHLFITQQVGDQTNRRLHELLGRTSQAHSCYPGAEQKPTWNLNYAVHELQEAGWRILDSKEAFYTTRYYDVGAIVYYLKAIPWTVPDFSPERYFDNLVEIRALIQREGYVDVDFHSFFVVAQK